ncbi:hypothetical protein RI129_012933 [Pyrocoelia pectoralis]|uniref:Uncharacterized protein n=1 Tax=Pyrocoelia pectoralis TaxID=417401 RepID=A0AAN7V0J3_9COLE
MSRLVIFSLCFTFIDLVRCQNVLNFQTCKQSDPNRDECLKFAIQDAFKILENGVPKFNLPPLQPLKLEQWTITAGKGVNFIQKLSNIEMINHAKSTIRKVESEISDNELSLKIESTNPVILFKFDYVFENAEIYGESVSGKGRVVMEHDNYTETLSLTGKVIDKDGNRYLSLTQVDVHYIFDDTIFKFETGDAEMDKKLNRIFNQNKEEILENLYEKYLEIDNYLYTNVASAIFSLIPYDQLFPK